MNPFRSWQHENDFNIFDVVFSIFKTHSNLSHVTVGYSILVATHSLASYQVSRNAPDLGQTPL